MTMRASLFALAALLVAATAPVPAAAEDWRSDAFGLYREGSDAERGRWAGLVLGEDADFRKVVAPDEVKDLAIFAGPKASPRARTACISWRLASMRMAMPYRTARAWP